MNKNIVIIFLCLNFFILGNPNEWNYNVSTIKNYNNFSTIGNINSWKHGTKDVMEKYDIKIEKVELYDDKIYPIFYVQFADVDKMNSKWGFKVLEEVLKANGYWNYAIIDKQKNVYFEVIGNKSMKTIEKILYNNTEISSIEKVQVMEEKVLNVIFELTEVKDYLNGIDKYNKKNNKNVKLVTLIQSTPNSKSTNVLDKNYYCVYVGESHETHDVRWNTFYVNKNLTEILIDDIDEGIVTLKNWRMLKKKRGF